MAAQDLYRLVKEQIVAYGGNEDMVGILLSSHGETLLKHLAENVVAWYRLPLLIDRGVEVTILPHLTLRQRAGLADVYLATVSYGNCNTVDMALNSTIEERYTASMFLIPLEDQPNKEWLQQFMVENHFRDATLPELLAFLQSYPGKSLYTAKITSITARATTWKLPNRTELGWFRFGFGSRRKRCIWNEISGSMYYRNGYLAVVRDQEK